MYRIATLNDMVDLVAWKRRLGQDVPSPWGLKRFGYLLTERAFVERTPRSVLEVGVGWTSNLHDVMARDADYWTVDEASYYPDDVFQRGLDARPQAKHVNGLMGQFLAELPDAYFDLTCSISVLEHSKPDDAPAICVDLFRVTAPGGVAVHTIDTAPNRPEFRMTPWCEAFQKAGFVLGDDVDLSYTARPNGVAALVEPLDVMVHYWKSRPDFWENPHVIRDHYVTIAVVATKPA